MIVGYHYKDIVMKLVISNVDQLERKHQTYLYRDFGGQSTPVFLPGDSHGQRNLAGCSPRGRRVGEVDTTEHMHIYT